MEVENRQEERTARHDVASRGWSGRAVAAMQSSVHSPEACSSSVRAVNSEKAACERQPGLSYPVQNYVQNS
jgi:hypothetical protein